jgi:hypothetical protein
MRRRSSSLFQLLFVLAILALTWFSFGQNIEVPRKWADIPERLGMLELVSSVEGSEAIEQVSQLHGNDFGLVEAYIVSYASSNERITTWVGRAESSDAAAELTSRMAERITKGNSGFSNLKRLTIAEGYHSHEVFQVDGPEGQHFFYLSRELADGVVWLSIEASDIALILEQAVNTF